MIIQSGIKNSFIADPPISVSGEDTGNGIVDPLVRERENAAMQNDQSINLDDALDDDNDNPVSQTLVSAAENSGTGEIRDTQELDGEEQESRER